MSVKADVSGVEPDLDRRSREFYQVYQFRAVYQYGWRGVSACARWTRSGSSVRTYPAPKIW